MPVEGVHIMQSQQVDVFFDEFDWEEVASYIEVHTTVRESGGILDGSGR